jgi:hypothetical protein
MGIGILTPMSSQEAADVLGCEQQKKIIHIRASGIPGVETEGKRLPWVF